MYFLVDGRYGSIIVVHVGRYEALDGVVSGCIRSGSRVRPMVRCFALLVTRTRYVAFTTHPTYSRLQALRLMSTRDVLYTSFLDRQ